jgi:hypothetical protein
MHNKSNKVVIVVSGGMVVSVFSSNPQTNVEVVDYDVQEEEENENIDMEAVEAEKTDGLYEVY